MSNYFIGIMILLLSGFVGMMFPKRHKISALSILVAIGSIFTLIPALNVFLSGESLSQTFFFNPVFGVYYRSLFIQHIGLSAFFFVQYGGVARCFRALHGIGFVFLIIQ